MSSAFVERWSNVNKTFDFILKYSKDFTDEVIVSCFRSCYDLHDLRVSVMHEELYKIDGLYSDYKSAKVTHLEQKLNEEERAMVKLTTAAQEYADKARELLIEDLENDVSGCAITPKK
jgi:hypothetical protein